MEWLLEEYGADGFMPMMIMYDSDPSTNLSYAQQKGLTFPVLSDTQMQVFARFDPTGEVPSSTIIDHGMVVAEVDTTWYQALIEEYVY